MTWDNVTILDREPKWFERGIKEAISRRTENSTLNRDGDRYQLPHIWDTLLAGETTLPPSANNTNRSVAVNMASGDAESLVFFFCTR